jgi:hypothetical protein
MVRSNRNSKTRRNKRGGNYPEAPIAQQMDYSQQIAAPIPQPEQQIAAPIPQPEQQIAAAAIPQPEQDSGSGFFGSVTNFFNSPIAFLALDFAALVVPLCSASN